LGGGSVVVIARVPFVGDLISSLRKGSEEGL